MKTKLFPKGIAVLSALLFSSLSFAQTQKTISYTATEVEQSELLLLGQPQIEARNYRVYKINPDEISAQLTGIAQRHTPDQGFIANINFPHPNGSIHTYRALENETISQGLQEQFPSVHTYDGTDKEGRKAKWDITPKGLHAMIMQPNESTVFIDPLFADNNQYYIVYYKKDFETDKIMDCSFNSDAKQLINNKVATSGQLKTFGSCELRTYRLALAATGEYTVFHGGTVGDAVSAQATTMNRVNGVFERDMAITMTIVPTNNNIIYTNGGSDPYTNGNPGAMINQNQGNCDTEIGNGSYDIGHVFGTNSGGLAGLGVVCNNSNKARGVTGSSAPIGDPFDIDYVAHEMGHQFGANHTQNNPCNSVNATRMEPGSASTIMGYAGICAPNVQSNSDDHFHGISLEEIGIEITSGGHTCEAITALVNSPPSIVSTSGNIDIPANTPFALTANVTDPDGDPILYCWEQMDNQASTQPPVSTSTGGPNFRSNSPINNPTRYFPNLADLAAGTSPTWEVLSSVSRTFNFRVTVRDQSLNVPGCNDHEDITVDVDGGSGPFVVLYPSNTGIVWTATTTETVTWDVAGTDGAPVSCSTVDIFLSTDGGVTYPTQLASGVNNDGAENITVPSIATTTARIMVMNSNGTFFDISDNNFEIDVPGGCTDPDVPTTTAGVTICEGQSTTMTVLSGALNDATAWQWYEGSCGGTLIGGGPNQLVSPTTTTSYFVRGEGGCVTPGACAEIIVQVNPAYNLAESASICPGQTYTYPDGSTSSVAESHTSNLSTTAGCDSIIVTTLSITTVDVGVTINGFGLDADATGATYQWVDCNNGYAPIAGETAQSFVPTATSGDYAVIVTESGCSDTSACVLLDQTNIGDVSIFEFKMYPNPATDQVLISWEGIVDEIEITDSRGKLVKKELLSGQQNIIIDLSHLEAGVYFVNLISEEGRAIKELVKH